MVVGEDPLYCFLITSESICVDEELQIIQTLKRTEAQHGKWFKGKHMLLYLKQLCTNHTNTENVVLWNLNTMRCSVLLQEMHPEHNCSDLEYLVVFTGDRMNTFKTMFSYRLYLYVGV